MTNSSAHSEGDEEPQHRRANTVRRRLKAPERRRVILVAARRAFSRTGDPNTTTISAIARAAKVSESVIYQHFVSKDELFFEAIVEPLRTAVATILDEAGQFNPILANDSDIPELTQRFWTTTITAMQEVFPLMGLVLFGETKRARAFYQGPFTEAVDELAAAWQRIYDEHAIDYTAREVVLACLGISIAVSLDKRYRAESDLATTIVALANITQRGFWPRLPTAVE
ncbi:helix-turn-helix domain-containing protein [Mycobacterium vicinigordonae]|uniref:TetR/AcrR family transcriptional regulator n=1 Tax=Mycobacterium vicinigordonae TaxID=1719132 RepID=A0A7D6E887_9MYCO|nr:TetR/AcrR family transcriptional regulator [Mycobacterium vicinigordonae]QLL07385.1 TetR/AcrR family transcriptional regulator [Mycobacterium vicinigordonae]